MMTVFCNKMMSAKVSLFLDDFDAVLNDYDYDDYDDMVKCHELQ